MNKERMAAMASRIAEEDLGEDTALSMVDQAIDTMMAAAKIMDENLPKVKTDNVPQKAAIDEVRQLLDEAVAPYLADIGKAMSVFD